MNTTETLFITYVPTVDIFAETKALHMAMDRYLANLITPEEFNRAADRFEQAVQAARGGQPIDVSKKP